MSEKNDRRAIAFWKLCHNLRNTGYEPDAREWAAQILDRLAIELAGGLNGYERVKSQYSIDLDVETLHSGDAQVLLEMLSEE